MGIRLELAGGGVMYAWAAIHNLDDQSYATEAFLARLAGEFVHTIGDQDNTIVHEVHLHKVQDPPCVVRRKIDGYLDIVLCEADVARLRT